MDGQDFLQPFRPSIFRSTQMQIIDERKDLLFELP
jgi:hypothetical protein